MNVADHVMNVSLRKMHCPLFQASLFWQNIFFFLPVLKRLAVRCSYIKRLYESATVYVMVVRSVQVQSSQVNKPVSYWTRMPRPDGGRDPLSWWESGTLVLALGLNSSFLGGMERELRFSWQVCGSKCILLISFSLRNAKERIAFGGVVVQPRNGI